MVNNAVIIPYEARQILYIFVYMRTMFRKFKKKVGKGQKKGKKKEQP